MQAFFRILNREKDVWFKKSVYMQIRTMLAILNSLLWKSQKFIMWFFKYLCFHSFQISRVTILICFTFTKISWTTNNFNIFTLFNFFGSFTKKFSIFEKDFPYEYFVSSFFSWQIAHLLANISSKWQNFTVKCDQPYTVSRESATVTSAPVLACLCVSLALATTSARSKKSDTTSFRVGPKSPEWSKRTFGPARNCALDSPRRLTGCLGRTGGMDGSRPGDFRLCRSVNVYTFYRQSPFLHNPAALYKPRCRLFPKVFFGFIFAKNFFN